MFEGKRRRPRLMVDGKALAPTAANMKYARRVALEIRERIRHGTFSMAEFFPEAGGDDGLTVGGWLDKWQKAQSLETSTKAGYSSAVKFWKAAIADVEKQTRVGTMALGALRTLHLLTAIAQRPDLTGKTVNNYVSVMRQALDLAVADKVIRENPADGVGRQKHQKAPPDPFSRDEAEAIISYMAGHYPEQIYNMVEAWFFSGPRTSEVFGQRWPNMDLRSGIMTIAEAVVRGEQKKSTKTNVARDVLLNSRALAAVNRQAKHTRLAGGHVWLDPRYGKPWTEERAFRRSYWTPCLKILGIRYRRPYNMRHTYATMMLMAGMTPAFCAGQMGHSVEMFLRTYAKWLNGAQNDLEMARFEASLGADSPQVRPTQNKSGA